MPVVGRGMHGHGSRPKAAGLNSGAVEECSMCGALAVHFLCRNRLRLGKNGISGGFSPAVLRVMITFIVGQLGG